MTARNYQASRDRCTRRAEHANNEEVRQIWLNLAETYDELLRFEEIDLLSPQIGGNVTK